MFYRIKSKILKHIMYVKEGFIFFIRSLKILEKIYYRVLFSFTVEGVHQNPIFHRKFFFKRV